MLDTTELIRRCKRKDRLAQKQLYQSYLPYLNSVCRRYLINPSDINDVLQESFINIFRNIDKYDAKKALFKTWAVKISINCTLKFNEKMNKVPVIELVTEQHVQTIDPYVLSKLNDEDLLIFLKTMPQKYSEIFNLNVIDGFSHKEISKILDIEESLSRKRLSRARAWLSSKTSKQFLKKMGLGH